MAIYKKKIDAIDMTTSGSKRALLHHATAQATVIIGSKGVIVQGVSVSASHPIRTPGVVVDDRRSRVKRVALGRELGEGSTPE
jgi:carbonic anhydrase/acetyltransferase-like protein (isoleucine patch superfamily)